TSATPSRWRATSSPGMTDVLVAALSARALAGSARASGFVPLAADLFCDLDLRDMAEDCTRIDGDLARGIEQEPLLRALGGLAPGRTPRGIVCGAGLEDRPQLLVALAARWRLLGSGAEAVRRVKDPAALAELCARLSIPHPRRSDS